ncbi:MAG: heavy-metal-associated domain-containing protein [Geitlerinemataceae cyanobacterium]
MSVQLKVPDMACSACANTIDQAVKQVDANAKVEADVTAKTVTIETQQPVEAIKKAIVAAGYTVD